MKNLIWFALLTLSPATFAAETICTITRLEAPEPSAAATTLFSDVIKDQESFLLKGQKRILRDYDLMRRKHYLELRRLNHAGFVTISHPAPGQIAITVGQFEIGAANALPISGMVIGADDRAISLTIPARRISVTCQPREATPAPIPTPAPN